MVGAVRAAAARVREEVGTALVVVARVAVVRGREEEVRAVTVVEMEMAWWATEAPAAAAEVQRAAVLTAASSQDRRATPS